MFNVNKGTAALQLLAASTRTATATGTGLDKASYTGRGMVVVNIGTVTGTTPTCDVKIQDSADNSTFADVSGATLAQQTATGIGSFAVDLDSTNRYLRVVATIAGTTPSFPIAVSLIAKKRVV
jgi:hypothetical protein